MQLISQLNTSQAPAEEALWMPVTTKLPGSTQMVLLRTRNFTAMGNYSPTLGWRFSNGHMINEEVLFWSTL